MGRQRGWVLTNRDLQVMRWLGTVGPMTCQQLWALAGRSGQEKNFKRRLIELSRKRGAVPNFIVVYRHESARLEPLFGLSHHGADRLGLEDEPPMPHNSWTEMRHQAQTAAVFAGLVAAQKDPARPNFTWHADRGHQWDFTRAGLRSERMSVRPDAIVDSKTHAIRVMVEVETGSHPVRRRDGGAGKSILGKVHRYAAWFTEYAPGFSYESWYEYQLGRERFPMIVVVTTSFRRRDLAARVIASDPELLALNTGKWGWMVVTTDDAGIQIDRLMNGLEPLPVREVRERLGVAERRRALQPVSPARSAEPSAAVTASGAQAPAPDLPWVRMPASAAQDLRDDQSTLIRFVNEYRQELGRLRGVLANEDRERVKALLHHDRSVPLHEAAVRMAGILKKLEADRCAAPVEPAGALEG